MIRKRAFGYLAIAIAGVGLTAFSVNRVLVAQAVLARPLTAIAVFALLACLLLAGTCVAAGMAFLFLKRFVAEVRRDGPTFTLVSASGQPLVSVNTIRVIKRIGNPYEYPLSQEDLFTIFSADKRWWICPSAAYAPDLGVEEQA
ncbi:hypothetical protein [Ralstonia solanacearum]|uniref:hypothetical protein n=1 Tax=Ralstonia solanacearum TaxID=305 RepID=UPI00078D5FBF|nr:hypothetical protein [Ralstonia solanacearum]AMP39296.1 hypothetical protein LBM2029_16865 [Ralstonia solanacearum]AXV88131.1 hypothetical protein CJO78_17355 [Ralstonia solanacearum]AXW07616.1 hypothetical protein CJO82_17010 [Ralstonia solanacearum]AXW25406.1 hypothetical protein CJO86_17260 [Ralstonia solanacearum]AXW82318.1 hypothetical protein CJO98_17370 [Ralstonia solanacearum]